MGQFNAFPPRSTSRWSLRRTLLVGAVLPSLLAAQPTDLFISEYVEGSANNKYIEIYNGTAANVNLANYQLRLYANGSGTATVGTPAMTGTLAPGATIVYRHTSATLYPGVVNSAMNFNGNDAIALYRTAAPAGFLDIVGNIGCDPGAGGWNSGLHSTVDRTLVRATPVCSGITTDPPTSCPFPTLASEWVAYDVDDVSNLGSHTGCISTVQFVTATTSAGEAAGTVNVNVTFNPASPGGTVNIVMNYGTGLVYGTDLTVGGAGVVYTAPNLIALTVPAGTTSATLQVLINDDIADEGNESLTFSIVGASAGMALGSILVHTFTIVDNDGLPSVTFTTTSVSVLETNTGPHPINISISPTVPFAVTVQIQVTHNLGMVYDGPPTWNGTDGDYYSTPAQVAGMITIIIPANQPGPTVPLSMYIWDDPNIDSPIETATFTIVTVTAGTSIGASNVATFSISDNEAFPTVLFPGDLAVVGLNTNNGGCSGNTSEDIVSFFCFKPITYGTKIILTDNGYERGVSCVPPQAAGTWGNNEGTVEMTRTGPNIPAGQVITWRITTNAGPGNVVGLAPDAGWTCASLNGFRTLQMNSGGDQLFFMQGGTWNTNTANMHDATYTGTVLYGFSTVPTPNSWVPFAGSCYDSGANQRSRLPLGMGCFSMAPTGATDFNKYVGSRAAKTQRDWMIAIDNTANWASYAPASTGCTQYNTAVPNWLTEPPLPIIVGGFTPGLWRGTTNTDWNECKNWDDVRVPVSTTNVRIDETASNHCEVGVSAGTTAVCASLVQTNSGTPRHLTVRNGSSLAVGGPITVQRTIAGSAIGLTVSNTGGASTLTATDLTVQGVTPGAAEAFVRNEAPSNTVLLSGNLSIGLGGSVDINGATTGGRISIGGNYSNAGPTEATLDETNGTIAFNGTGNQTISTAGFSEVFWELVLTKSSGSVTLNVPLEIRDTIFFDSGLLNTSLTPGLLTMRAGSGWRNATDASFVNGPMQKIGFSDFTFPVGKGLSLRPAGIRNILPASGAPRIHIAEYFPASAYSWGIDREASLDHLSDCEYWRIDELNTTGTTAIVELTWRAPNSCGVTDLSELRVARWDDAAVPAPGLWRDRGNGGAAGDVFNGTIPTATAQTTGTDYNSNDLTAWTLSSTTANNPLPITLVDFAAKPEGSAVRLTWTTASEYENAMFTVERSRYGSVFEHVVDVPGAVFSTTLLHYTDLDRYPYEGLSYYRLRQTDLDGSYTYSATVPVLFGGLHDRPLVVFGREGALTAVHGFGAGSRYELLDMTGRVISSGSTTIDGRTELTGVILSRGAYVFRMTDGTHVESERFVY